MFVAITGAEFERAEAEDLVAQCGNSRCISFAGHSTVADLPGLYALAVAMITND